MTYGGFVVPQPILAALLGYSNRVVSIDVSKMLLAWFYGSFLGLYRVTATRLIPSSARIRRTRQDSASSRLRPVPPFLFFSHSHYFFSFFAYGPVSDSSLTQLTPDSTYPIYRLPAPYPRLLFFIPPTLPTSAPDSPPRIRS
ncbi:hypothetical protein C8R47DRAFT_1329152 [Mycena vitilis]|nr:hypothetical protein C8R47DRAFT_1329152 [Mycena vitilis]